MKKTKLYVAIVENDLDFRKFAANEIMQHKSVSRLDQFSSSEEFLDSVKNNQYDLLFLDILLPGISGLDMLSYLNENNYLINTIIITTLASDNTIVKAIQNGAVGYLWKSEIKNISEMIDIFLDGGATITPTIALKMMRLLKNSIPDELPLTTRESQILEILISGASCKKSAEILEISINTMRKHVRNIYEKLQVKNRTELVNRTRNSGIKQIIP